MGDVLAVDSLPPECLSRILRQVCMSAKEPAHIQRTSASLVLPPPPPRHLHASPAPLPALVLFLHSTNQLTTLTNITAYHPRPPLCSLLSPTDLAAAACTHRAWRQAVAAEEGLWQALCEADYSLSAATAPDGAPLQSFRAAYATWRAEFGRYGGLATRALRAWRQVESWLGDHLPKVAASLR